MWVLSNYVILNKLTHGFKILEVYIDFNQQKKCVKIQLKKANRTVFVKNLLLTLFFHTP